MFPEITYREREVLLAIKSVEWSAPAFARSQVDWAGKILTNPSSDIFLPYWDEALDVISNWRSSHNYPLNTFQVTLRTKSRKVDPNSIVAQRIKRLSSIYHKLDRFKNMKLSQIQDIGGCRAILGTSEEVYSLVDSYRKSQLRHRLYRVTDYIESPRASGYRGIHLLYQYHSENVSTAVYNGLRIEMQIRSSLQHAWATAVETVSSLTSQALKSSLGEAQWLRFFALMGSVIAIRENRPVVPGTPNALTHLISELRTISSALNAVPFLQMVGSTLNTLEQPLPEHQRAHFFLLQLDPANRQSNIKTFRLKDAQAASEEYIEIEKRLEQGNPNGMIAVLVSVENIAALRRAYPNYFLDTHVFTSVLEETLSI